MKEKRKKEKGKAQTYLERIQKLDVQIECLGREKLMLKDMALRITPSMSGSGGATGGNQDKLSSTVTRIIAKEEEIDRAVDQLISLKQEASTLLSRLDDPAHIQVLHGRYIQYKSFERIATEMGYTYRNVCYLHGRALQAFGKVLEEYWQTPMKDALSEEELLEKGQKYLNSFAAHKLACGVMKEDVDRAIIAARFSARSGQV